MLSVRVMSTFEDAQYQGLLNPFITLSIFEGAQGAHQNSGGRG